MVLATFASEHCVRPDTGTWRAFEQNGRAAAVVQPGAVGYLPRGPPSAAGLPPTATLRVAGGRQAAQRGWRPGLRADQEGASSTSSSSSGGLARCRLTFRDGGDDGRPNREPQCTSPAAPNARRGAHWVLRRAPVDTCLPSGAGAAPGRSSRQAGGRAASRAAGGGAASHSPEVASCCLAGSA